MGSTDTEINWTKEYRHQPTSSEQTLAQRREHPYIWTTWLPRLLTGENSCEWAIWFKAHHQNWAQVPSDFNQAEWMLNHTSLLNEKKSQWEARRQKVYVEGQNSFRLRGQSATLAGRPDLIVVRSNDALIIDVKAGTGAARALRTDHDLHVRPAPSAAPIPTRQAGRRNRLSDADKHEYQWAACTRSSKRTSEP